MVPDEQSVTNDRLVNALVPILEGVWAQLSLLAIGCLHESIGPKGVHDALLLVAGELAQGVEFFHRWQDGTFTTKATAQP